MCATQSCVGVKGGPQANLNQPNSFNQTITKEAEFLCIGSGPAGQRATVQTGKMGLRIGVIEKRRVEGKLIGTE